jgi:hypothetical protein
MTEVAAGHIQVSSRLADVLEAKARKKEWGRCQREPRVGRGGTGMEWKLGDVD